MSNIQKINFFGSFIFFLIVSLFSFGQIAVGQWRDHLPYNSGAMIAVAGSDVYMLTDVGLLKYSTTTGETSKLSKISGLSDSGVKSIGYNQATGYVVLGYKNGNIDLINGSEIINISDIKRKSMNSDKAIYCMDFVDDIAYLGLGFGIVVVDIKRLEIRKTWYVGENGTNVKINAIDINDGNVYVATNKGILKGNLNNALVDFSKWEILSDINQTGSLSWMSGQNYEHLYFINGYLLASFNNVDAANADTVLVFNGNSWDYFDNAITEVVYLGGNDDEFYLCASFWMKIYDADLNEKRHVWEFSFPDGGTGLKPNFAIHDGREGIWIADGVYGLVHNPVSWKYDKISVNGPSGYEVFDMDAVGKELVGVSGGMNLSWSPNWKRGTYYHFSQQMWNTYDNTNAFQSIDLRDFVRVKIDPNDKTRCFLGSWIHGLVEMRNNQLYKVYNDENSTLQKVPSVDYIRIGGLDFDSDGNLWVANSLTAPQFHVMTTDGNWHSFDYSSLLGGKNIGRIIVTKNNHKWAILPQGSGLFAFDDNKTIDYKNDDRFRQFSVINEDGEIVSNDVYSIAEDKDGNIWVGTNKGVVVYYNPEDVFESGAYQGRQVKIPRDDGTDNADILLANEIVSAIYVDGANKKWFGTQTGGVYYTSEDGLKEIYHFTTENSPLLDNNIISISIIPETGEVFFGTARGMISYRNTATEASDDYVGVYAFPNPVKPDYTGPITVSGLVAGSYVKITDISGNLVFETRSEGGSAVWYGKDLNGNKVHTGVYLVFSSNETGSKTDITKILFIN
ncbi:MAG: two-component regulator propeller domain-containing protein [Bacteroidales bacterium]|nr:two-component regulator propeller domain-containing protein [Bacteroidales bacterium]